MVWISMLVSVATSQDSQPVSRPNGPSAWTDEAVRLGELGRFDEAIALLERARSAAPGDAFTTTNVARMLMRRAQARMKDGAIDGAREDLERGLRLTPKDALIRVQLAVVLRQSSDNFGARREVTTALEHDPACAAGFEELARVAYEDDDLVSAIDALETSRRLAPDSDARTAEFLARLKREWGIEKDFFHDERGSFTVKYDDQAFKNIGSSVLDDLDRAEQKLRATLGHVPKRRISVVLYTRDDFRAATGAHAWTGGLYDGKIRVPARNFTEVRDAIAHTLVHEYTHVVVRDLTRHCPTWLNEGLAQLVEGKVPARRGELGPKDQLRRIRTLPTNWFSIQDTRQVTQLYAQSLAFTDFLVKRAGYGALRELLLHLDGRTAFEAALEGAFGKGLDELEDDWRRDA